ncbi:MAG: hypothetical protein RL701_6512 [Pseudomonadota bacterium]
MILGSNPCTITSNETTCTIGAATKPNQVTLVGPSEPCRKIPTVTARTLVLGFEDYPEVDVNDADCSDPAVTLTAKPEG